MPELPEVETSRRGIAPWVENQVVSGVVIRERRLRWPVPTDIDRTLPGCVIRSVRRRAKYLLFDTDVGSVMLHLGMSGSVRIVDADEPAAKHDHVDICFENGKALRFRDPRRFGSLLWAAVPEEHALLRQLGPEPLSAEFDGRYLWQQSRGRRVSIKQPRSWWALETSTPVRRCSGREYTPNGRPAGFRRRECRPCAR